MSEKGDLNTLYNSAICMFEGNFLELAPGGATQSMNV